MGGGTSLDVVIRGREASVRIADGLDGAAFFAAVDAFEKRLSGGDGWTVIYDLSGRSRIGVLETQRLIDLHQRLFDRIERVAFYSGTAMVRGSAIVVGSSAPIRWKVTSDEPAVRSWLSTPPRASV
jgi:hypothetical protein